VKKIKLQGGFEFLKSALTTGDYLAESLETLPLDQGLLYTFLPDSVDPSKLDLRHGGLGQLQYDEDLQAPVDALIFRFLADSSANVAIIEAASVERNKLPDWLATAPAGFKYFTLNRTRRRAQSPETKEEIPLIGIYGFLGKDQATPEYIRNFIDEAFPFQKVGVLTSIPKDISLTSGQEITPEWLKRIAPKTQHIFVTAYDGSGWVVWSHKDADPESAATNQENLFANAPA
jgi:hypothetical protein